MSRRCDLFFKGVMVGNNVAHSKTKTKRVFRPNLQRITFYSEILKSKITLKLCRSATRTVEKYGGIDGFFLSFKWHKLTDLGKKYKSKIIKQK